MQPNQRLHVTHMFVPSTIMSQIGAEAFKTENTMKPAFPVGDASAPYYKNLGHGKFG